MLFMHKYILRQFSFNFLTCEPLLYEGIYFVIPFALTNKLRGFGLLFLGYELEYWMKNIYKLEIYDLGMIYGR